MVSPGALLLDKPEDVTSFGALSAVKRAFGTRKVGHTGTLDRFATGLLVVLLGRATRLADLASAQCKSYDVQLVFGSETDTLDPTGEVVAEGGVPSAAEVIKVLPDFTGEIEQVPPSYSAVHVAGRRASDLVRAGETPVLDARVVRVDEVELVAMDEERAHLRIVSGKGFYVRSFARDLARALGTVAHVQTLRRTSVGSFSVHEAVAPEDVRPDRDMMSLEEFLAETDDVAFVDVGSRYEKLIRNGAPLEERFLTDRLPESSHLALRSEAGAVLAVAERVRGEGQQEPRFRYRVVFS